MFGKAGCTELTDDSPGLFDELVFLFGGLLP
jgi:hypothetical protein